MRTALGCWRQRGLIGVGTLVDWRQGVGQEDSVGRTASRMASGPWLVRAAGANGVRVSATAWVGCRQDVCRDLGQSDLRTQTASGCRQQRELVIVRTWVDRHRGVGRAGESVG